MALLEGERSKLKEDLIDMRAEEKQCLEKAYGILDRVETEQQMAGMLIKRANLLSKMARDNEILIWGKDTFLGRIQAWWGARKEQRKEERERNDRSPSV